MEQNLINKLVAPYMGIVFYPSKNKKKEKKQPQYLHISNHYFEKKDENGVVSVHRVGFTYRKE